MTGLFPALPRRPRIARMHVVDAGVGPRGGHHCRFVCGRCGTDSGWVVVATITEAKRGLPYPTCNDAASVFEAGGMKENR